MSWFRETRGEITQRLTPAILFFCAAASIAWAYLVGGNLQFHWPLPDSEHWLAVTATASPLLFLGACVLVLLRPRFGYGLGLAAAGIVLAWVVRTEFLLAPGNSWIYLNYEFDPEPQAVEEIRAFVGLRILSVAMVVTASACALLRLAFPRRRAWPAFAAGLVVMAVWFIRSAIPYGEPGFDHALHQEIRILHVLKRGLRFHETLVTAERDGKVWVRRGDRRLFRYKFIVRADQASLGGSPATLDRMRLLVRSPELWKLRTPPPAALRSWNAEGWYVILKDSRVLAFTSEQGTAPPREVVELFGELDALPEWAPRPVTRRDICLGFCYDPVAALGFVILPQRIRLLEDSAAGAGRRSFPQPAR